MIQVRLWNDCYNGCSFCSIKRGYTSTENKKKRIQKLLELEDDTIGLIGGEFFEGQLKGLEKEWLHTIKNLKCDKLYITANLINEQYLLKETLVLRPILICTSYDSVGRFKNYESKLQWLERVNSLSNVCCTIIPTQDMVNDNFIEQIKCPINLCEPHLGVEWYKNINKENYHDSLVKENKLFTFPKRKELLHWLAKRPNVVSSMMMYKHNHFSTILGFNDNDEFVYESKDRFNDRNFMAECGHPYFSRCYSDSDRCLMCDLEEML